ncbi:MAG: hypothetical protein PVJ76_10015 [Gemmatimonadota bacterium]|jgi:hypothetical protein
MPSGIHYDNIMSRQLPIFVALSILALLLAAPRAQGQSIPSSYEFFETKQEAGVFVGFTNQGTGRFGYGPSPGTILGARYSINVGGPFGLEGVLAYQPTTRDLVDPSRDEGDRVVAEADAKLVSFDARLRFSLTGDRTWHGIHPFLITGIGFAWDVALDPPQNELLLPDDRYEFGTKFVALFGGGARWFLTDRILLRGDVFVNMYQLKTPRGYLDTSRDFTGVGEKEWVSGPILSIGTAWHF